LICGTMGGFWCRSRPQLMLENHLCCLTSLAPDWLPSRLCSSLHRSFLMRLLHRVVVAGWSGKPGSLRSTFEKVACRLEPLKGVQPYSISYTRIPTVHLRG